MNMPVLAPDDPLKKMIDTQIEEMRKTAIDLVKHEIFDWTPTPDQPATSGGSLLSIFGGASVGIKSSYQRHGVHLDQTLILNGSIAVYDTKSGDLNDLEPAIRANLDKYLAIVDIGEFFKKVQVVAKTNVNFSERLPDGTNLSDPIKTVQIEVGYPDFSQPLDANNTPNPQYRAEGLHYTIGQRDPHHGNELAVWTRDNPNDVINISS